MVRTKIFKYFKNKHYVYQKLWFADSAGQKSQGAGVVALALRLNNALDALFG